MPIKIRKPVEGIFFDLGWTLLKPASGDWLLSGLFFEMFGGDVFARISEEKLRAVMAQGIAVLNEKHLLDTFEEEYAQFFEFFTLISENVPGLGMTSEQAASLAYDKVYNDDNYIIFEDSAQTLQALRGKYRLGIISDTWPSLRRVLENARLMHYFDTVTFSCHLGVCKPGEKMYLDALSKMNLPPRHTIFIDDFCPNLDGAARQGIQPVLITVRPGSDPCEKYLNIGKISDILLYL